MADSAPAPTLLKKRVTMRSVFAAINPEDGKVGTAEHKAVDYVPLEILEAYVADAKTHWQYVEVSEEYDDGPGGALPDLVVPANLDHPEAGNRLVATPEGEDNVFVAAEPTEG